MNKETHEVIVSESKEHFIGNSICIRPSAILCHCVSRKLVHDVCNCMSDWFTHPFTHVKNIFRDFAKHTLFFTQTDVTNFNIQCLISNLIQNTMLKFPILYVQSIDLDSFLQLFLVD